MHSSTILTLFLCCLFLMVKASPVPDPLPEAIPGDDQALACQPPPDYNGNQQPEEGGGNEKPEEKQRKKQEEEDAKRMKKEKEREQKDAERAKADEERARKESNQKPPPPGGNNQGGGGGGGGEGGVRGNTEQPPPPPPKQEGPPKQGGGNNNGGGNQGGGGGGGQGGGEQKPPPTKQPPSGTQPPPPGSSPVGGKTFTGPATFYGGNLQGGNCMMQGYQLPPGVYGAAIGGDNWDNSGNCGACAKVSGPGGKSVIIMFVDKCPECAQGLDLFPDAFKQLNDPSVGRFTVTWEFVTCPVQGPLKIKDKEGTNEYYVSMQVQNGKEATQSLEISPDGGKTYKMGQREDSNHFVFNGQVGAQTVDVRVTSKSGKKVVVPGVPVSGAEKEAPQNYD